MDKETKSIQECVDKHRKRGVTINVDHYTAETEEDGISETTISVAFKEGYDAMEVADEIRELLTEECDSGAGCGFRDLQLCRLLPDLK